MDEKYQNEAVTLCFSRNVWIEETVRLILMVAVEQWNRNPNTNLSIPERAALENQMWDFARLRYSNFAAYSQLPGPVPPDRGDIVQIVMDQFQGELERTGHELEAVVAIVEREAPNAMKPFIHLGLTSSDMMDTVMSKTLKRARTFLITDITDGLMNDLGKWAPDGLTLIGRTHGKEAEPMSWKHKTLTWKGDIGFVLKELYNVILPGKLSGSVGEYHFVGRDVEDKLMEVMKMRTFRSTQCVGRHHYANLAMQLAMLSSVMAKVALDMRLLVQDGVKRIWPKPGVSQGHGLNTTSSSSSMPHKVNPIGLERVCGMARLARHLAYVHVESIELWNERDISHSATDRTTWPDLFHIVLHQAKCLQEFMAGHEPVPIKVCNASVYSQSLSIAYRRSGVPREEARSRAVHNLRNIVHARLPNESNGGVRGMGEEFMQLFAASDRLIAADSTFKHGDEDSTEEGEEGQASSDPGQT